MIRETLRLITNGTLLRRNIVNDDMKIDGRKVEKGAFLAYNMADVHLREDIYQDALKFDPGRYEKGQGKEGSLTFLGWGAGRSFTVCSRSLFTAYIFLYGGGNPILITAWRIL